ncbi:MAG: hypothetical protein K8L91_18610 [Anaerolineae bacterium]|nr:hypothetical protein [Anaerolineae bacterium]
MSAYRRLAVFVWIALWGVVMLIPHPIQAQDGPSNEILVDGITCTLTDAINAANTDEPSGGCTAGKGADVLRLRDNLHVTKPLPNQGDGLALPVIVTDITIEGDGHTIWVISEAPMTSLLLFFVLADRSQNNPNESSASSGREGKLTLRHLTLSGSDRPSQQVALKAIANLGGEVWLEGVNLFYFGIPYPETLTGAVTSDRGVLRINDSNFSQNATLGDGGVIYAQYSQVTIISSTFVENAAGGYGLGGDGGAIYLMNCEYFMGGSTYGALSFEDNQSVQRGGAIFSSNSTGTIRNALFRGNRSSVGGAIFHGFNDQNSLSITDSQFINNQAINGLGNSPISLNGGNGGALFNNGLVSVQRSLFWGNVAQMGGAIYDGDLNYSANEGDGSGSTLLESVSIIGNTANQGGAAIIYRGAQITNSTIVGNLAWRGEGGGLFAPAPVKIFVHNVIIAQNFGGDCYATDVVPGQDGRFTGSHNRDGDGSCPDSQPITGLETTPLHNGGYTITLALGPDSNAIDTGNPEFCPATDQRGALPVGNCDIGAFEYGAMALPEVRNPDAIAYVQRDDAWEASVEAEAQRRAEAFAQLVAAVEADPDNPKVYFDRGVAYVSRQEHELALADFKQALALDPLYAEAQIYIFFIYLYGPFKDCGQATLAMALYEELAPQDETLRSYDGALKDLCAMEVTQNQ